MVHKDQQIELVAKSIQHETPNHRSVFFHRPPGFVFEAGDWVDIGTVVCFHSGSSADERLVLPLFTPFIEQGEIANLPAYSYYVRIAAVRAQELMSVVTVAADDEGSQIMAERVSRSSRKLYGRKEVIEEVAGNAETQVPQQTKRIIAAKPAKTTRTKKARSRKRDELSALRTQE